MSHQTQKSRKKIFVALAAIGRTRAGKVFWLGLALALTNCLANCSAQIPRFSDPYEIQSGTGAPQGPAFLQGNVTPQFNPQFSPQGVVVGPQAGTIQPPAFNQVFPGAGSTPAPITSFPPPAVIQNQPNVIPGPVFDPFNTNNNPWPIQPQNPNGSTPFFLPPNNNPPVQSFGNGPFGNSNLLQNYPQGSAPSRPGAWPNQVWSRLRNDTMPRFLERPRWRQTWLPGSGADELDMLETEIATTATLPGLQSNLTALRISPGFIFHFLDGPDTAITGFDLPAQVYSPHVAFDLMTDPRKPGGIEVDVTLGVYSDFKNISSDSLRITGTGLGFVRVNPYTVFKLGVEYYDRVDLKMLPAFGFFMQPNNEMKLDLFFPRPRFSHKLPSLANYEVWGYVGAEYGGGSWTIERIFGADDQVDVNDVRAFVGLEWAGPRRVTGFLEGGYVFERELLYRSDPANSLRLQDTLMIRTGISF